MFIICRLKIINKEAAYFRLGIPRLRFRVTPNLNVADSLKLAGVAAKKQKFTQMWGRSAIQVFELCGSNS